MVTVVRIVNNNGLWDHRERENDKKYFEISY